MRKAYVNDLIDRGELLETLWRSDVSTREKIDAIVRNQSAAYPPNEKTARWIYGYCDIQRMRCWYCEKCGNAAYWDTDYGQQLFDFCPYCGKKMEKVRKKHE